MPNGDNCFVLGQRIGDPQEHQVSVSVSSLSDAGDIFVLAFVESLAKLATASPFFMFLPTPSFLHNFLFPVTSETASRSLSGC